MKISLNVREESVQEVTRALREEPVEITEEAPYILSEVTVSSGLLTVRDLKNEERVLVPLADVVQFAAFGHTVEVRTREKIYSVSTPLYKLNEMLEERSFLRVSNSVIVAVGHIRQIKPTLSMRFILTMSDGSEADVTRSYYYAFKEYFHI
ncbi:MAG: LytTR family transcriptional regulator [Clostridiales bacterium]|nr:LytTR family transcriptional regulator [Clostridiales bacterium]